ncbi:GNAT family N-acetyltransferase [Alkalihalophilus lindianensis]|uniref:GNAT family N-acetyltransferase n=1 Tax=Alkalihalophilus lindianensis TaxID=1630542 RepID=A0ABU3X530_9BACI|nr:GNAT family N-acetyltransferase [Alkalihalophilus lindianensis]MDV2682996.1 GNAT family N-acetyltransferase [Alkalihalophilus lindianensis]
MEMRNVTEADYVRVISVIDDWWGGRMMSDLLQRLFFIHFQETSFVIEEKGTIIGFLIGFPSQTLPKVGYIHFVGIHPKARKEGYARILYEAFFEKVRELGCEKIECITSPVNKGSVAFHKRIGFKIKRGTTSVNGLQIYQNYDGPGKDRVLFEKELS